LERQRRLSTVICFAFLELAGFGRLSYRAGQDIVHTTADLMGLDRAHLDHSIWRYMSGGEASAADLMCRRYSGGPVNGVLRGAAGESEGETGCADC